MSRTRRPSKSTLSVLHCLSDSRQGLHGYALMQATGLASGTLYPILMRLTDREWLERDWVIEEESDGPPRRIYRLTAKGAREFSQLTSSTSTNLQEISP